MSLAADGLLPAFLCPAVWAKAASWHHPIGDSAVPLVSCTEICGICCVTLIGNVELFLLKNVIQFIKTVRGRERNNLGVRRRESFDYLNVEREGGLGSYLN